MNPLEEAENLKYRAASAPTGAPEEENGTNESHFLSGKAIVHG